LSVRHEGDKAVVRIRGDDWEFVGDRADGEENNSLGPTLPPVE
jgi:hypothetical protein